MKTSDIKIASKIGSKFLKAKVFSAKPIGQGSNNKNFLVKSKGQEVVVKLSLPHKEYQAYEMYVKEEWCIGKSSKKGIPGPKVLAVGKSSGRAYMIETFVPGENGKKLKDKSRVYYNLGKYTKLIHSIKTSGFGETLIDARRGTFKDSWARYLDYNIKSLTDSDKLIKMKILTSDQSKKVKKIFQDIKKKKYKFGLSHGDISSWNTLVEKSGKVNLLDWGSAQAHIIPHYDFIHVMRHNVEYHHLSDQEFGRFLKGYGMPRKKFKALEPELLRLMLLIYIDKLRWATDKNPAKIKMFIKKVKRVLKLNMI